jgi:hypothetical protein
VLVVWNPFPQFGLGYAKILKNIINFTYSNPKKTDHFRMTAVWFPYHFCMISVWKQYGESMRTVWTKYAESISIVWERYASYIAAAYLTYQDSIKPVWNKYQVSRIEIFVKTGKMQITFPWCPSSPASLVLSGALFLHPDSFLNCIKLVEQTATHKFRFL